MKQYDFIIAGGGLSGLAFLNELLSRAAFEDSTVLVIDLERKEHNDRTWSFWATADYHLPQIPGKVWSTARVTDSNGENIDFDLAPYYYKTIRAKDFYDHVKSTSANRPNVEFVQDEILECKPDGHVVCRNATFVGRKIIKSYFMKQELSVLKGDVMIWQHFRGWFIKTRTAAFDPDRVVIMDYRHEPRNITQFFYVLPFSKHEALIEYTEFSNRTLDSDQYDQLIRKYVDEMKIGDYEVVEAEENAIPMTDHYFDHLLNDRVISIGTIGGYVKASSGYCFTRTFDRVKKLVDLLETTVEEKKLRSRFRFWIYDALLLRTLNRNGFTGKLVFTALFREHVKDRSGLLFKFLDERTSLKEELRIIFAMPGKALLTATLFRELLSGRILRTFLQHRR